MNRLNPDQLYVELGTGVTLTEPVIGRKYTLTHSDITADLFLNIGMQFAYDKITAMRDEVLAEWRLNNNLPYLFVYVYVDGQLGMTAIRNMIFRRELPLALEAIRYGDREFFEFHTELGEAPIWIYFASENPKYNRLENWVLRIIINKKRYHSSRKASWTYPV